MKKQDVLNGARGKPKEFVGPDGFQCLLRPLTWGERKELLEWLKEHGQEPGSGLQLQEKLLLAGISDAEGKPLLTAEDLKDFDGSIADAVTKEIQARNGMDQSGNGPSPTTTS